MGELPFGHRKKFLLAIGLSQFFLELDRKSRSATLPANFAVCSVLKPLSRIRTGNGSPSR